MEKTQQDMQEIRSARSRFIAMAATYFLGVFNDNFFKQAALLLAVVAGLSGLQGKATMLFPCHLSSFRPMEAGWPTGSPRSRLLSG